MKILFAGTPEVAIPTLEHLYNSRHDVVAVLTRRDAELGRKRVLTPSPVAARAEALGIPLIKSDRIDATTRELIAEVAPDLAVVVAYGALVDERTLRVPKHGWINLHFSQLPAWRGAAPVQYSILHGDTTGGATVFELVKELDAGPVYGSVETEITDTTTSADLLSELAHSGAELVSKIVNGIDAGNLEPREQLGEVSLAPKVRLEDALIDWDAPARNIIRRINAMTPEPGAFSWLGSLRFKIGRAALVDDALLAEGSAVADGSAPLDGAVSANRSHPAAGEVVADAQMPVNADGLSAQTDVAQPPGTVTVNTSIKRVLVATQDVPIELIQVQPAGKKMMDARDWARGHFANPDSPRQLRAEPSAGPGTEPGAEPSAESSAESGTGPGTGSSEPQGLRN